MNIQQMIQQGVHGYMQTNKFNVSPLQRHIHNDVDSPYVFQPILTYIGNVGADGSIGLLPIGWSVTYQDVGSYLITHNLNTQLYTVCVSPENLNALAVPLVEPFPNSFEVITYNVGVDPIIPVNAALNFILVNINNKSTKIPKYGGSLIS